MLFIYCFTQYKSATLRGRVSLAVRGVQLDQSLLGFQT